MRSLLAATALLAAGCSIKLTPSPTTLQGAPTASTYQGRCPLAFDGLVLTQLQADDTPYSQWKAPDDDAKHEMSEAPDEYNRMAKACEQLQGSSTSALKLTLRKAQLYPHRSSRFTYDVTDASGTVVHAFAQETQMDWNPFLQARFQAMYLCQYLMRACDGAVD